MTNSWKQRAAVVMGLLLAGTAYAQDATSVVTIERDQADTTIKPGDYYTHVFIDVPSFTVPADDNGRKQLGKAILSALGLNEKTRSLTVTMILTYNGDSLPEIPLITYTFDGSKRLTNYQRIQSYFSPRWQVGAANLISAKLNYRYSEQTVIDPKAISDRVSQVIPSDAIVNALSKPFVQSLAGLTGSIFEIAGSRTVTNGAQDDLSPYSGFGSRALTFKLFKPNGIPLGDIKATLRVTPTLARTPFLTSKAKAEDLKKPDEESIADLQINQAGTTKNLIAEIKGVSEYATAVKERSVAAVSSYCTGATRLLNGYGLTRMDRTTLIYQSLTDASFLLTDNAWLLGCFTDSADRASLTTARSVSFVLAKPPIEEVVDPLNLKWPAPLKDAMGCWVTNQTGTYCLQKAPAARSILEKAMASEVRVGLMDLPGFDAAVLPYNRVLSRATLLDAIGGKASLFRCYELGLILIANDQPYTLGVTLESGKITGIQVQRAAPEAAQCLVTS